MMFETSILLITFNRPSHTKRILERILEINPLNLYVFQDGPRDNNYYDIAKCKEVRDLIIGMAQSTNGVILHTYYSDENLGCGAGPMTAIKWFFSNVEQGIVMEDDCFAHPDFFNYSEELLNRYKNNKRIGFINSTLYKDSWKCKYSYGFSHYMVTGAWAAWRETWQGFDLDLDNFHAKRFFIKVLLETGSFSEAMWWFRKVRNIQHDKSKKSYWDYQMQILLFEKGLITIHPQVNLISNIGFDPEGTHTLENDGFGNLPHFPILPLSHPKHIHVNKKVDFKCWSKAYADDFSCDVMSLCKIILKNNL